MPAKQVSPTTIELSKVELAGKLLESETRLANVINELSEARKTIGIQSQVIHELKEEKAFRSQGEYKASPQSLIDKTTYIYSLLEEEEKDTAKKILRAVTALTLPGCVLIDASTVKTVDVPNPMRDPKNEQYSV